MKKNVGFADSVVRIIVAGVIIALGFGYHSWWGLLGLLPLITGLLSFCPLYYFLGISTRPKKLKK